MRTVAIRFVVIVYVICDQVRLTEVPNPFLFTDMEDQKHSSKEDLNYKDKEETKDYYAFDLYPDRRNKMGQSWIGSFFVGRGKGSDKLTCQRNVLTAVKNNPLIRILIGALEQNNCNFDLYRNVSCEACDSKVTGGYDSEWNQIVICHNQSKACRHPEITLVHELIHMYDYCTNKVDFKNIDHLACSEIRAANLSHCSFVSSFLLSQSSLFNIKKTHQYCVKLKATQSLMVARNLDFDTAFKSVLKVFTKCYNDLEPIGRRVKRNSRDHHLAYKESVAYGYNKPIE